MFFYGVTHRAASTCTLVSITSSNLINTREWRKIHTQIRQAWKFPTRTYFSAQREAPVIWLKLNCDAESFHRFDIAPQPVAYRKRVKIEIRHKNCQFTCDNKRDKIRTNSIESGERITWTHTEHAQSSTQFYLISLKRSQLSKLFSQRFEIVMSLARARWWWNIAIFISAVCYHTANGSRLLSTRNFSSMVKNSRESSNWNIWKTLTFHSTTWAYCLLWKLPKWLGLLQQKNMKKDRYTYKRAEKKAGHQLYVNTEYLRRWGEKTDLRIMWKENTYTQHKNKWKFIYLIVLFLLFESEKR